MQRNTSTAGGAGSRPMLHCARPPRRPLLLALHALVHKQMYNNGSEVSHAHTVSMRPASQAGWRLICSRNAGPPAATAGPSHGDATPSKSTPSLTHSRPFPRAHPTLCSLLSSGMTRLKTQRQNLQAGCTAGWGSPAPSLQLSNLQPAWARQTAPRHGCCSNEMCQEGRWQAGGSGNRTAAPQLQLQPPLRCTGGSGHACRHVAGAGCSEHARHQLACAAIHPAPCAAGVRVWGV